MASIMNLMENAVVQTTVDYGVPTYLMLNNPTNNHLHFRIKTTACKVFHIRPRSGVLEPKALVEVAFTPRSDNEDPPNPNPRVILIKTTLASREKILTRQVGVKISPDLIKDIDYLIKDMNTFDPPSESVVLVPARPDCSHTIGNRDHENGVVDDLPVNENNRQFPDACRQLGLLDFDFSEEHLQRMFQEVLELRKIRNDLSEENVLLKRELGRLRARQNGARAGPSRSAERSA